MDRRIRTSNRRVYAAGDVTGVAGFTHVATRQAENVVRRLLRHLRTHDPPACRASPSPIPNWPMSASQRRRRDFAAAASGCCAGPFRRKRAPRPNIPWPGHQGRHQPQGHVLGATIVGAIAGDDLVLDADRSQRMNIRDLAELAVPHPTLAEIGRQAVIGDFDPRLTVSRTRRMLAWLRGRFR